MHFFTTIKVGISTLIPLLTSFPKYVIEGDIEGIGRQGRRHKQLLDDLKQTRRYWKLKEEALD
jgi:predicted urease superfamily metal-dependent hydrolase